MSSAVLLYNQKEEHPMRESLKKLPGKSELYRQDLQRKGRLNQ